MLPAELYNNGTTNATCDKYRFGRKGSDSVNYEEVFHNDSSLSSSDVEDKLEEAKDYLKDKYGKAWKDVVNKAKESKVKFVDLICICCLDIFAVM